MANKQQSLEEKNAGLKKELAAKNRELEIESSLERVRTVAMSMNKADDMLRVCRAIAEQLELLKVKEIRNIQTAIFYESKGTYMNYEYYAKHNKTIITETSYTNNEMHKAFAAQMMKGAGEFFASSMNGDEVKDWIVYQKTTNVFIDTFLETATSLNYYWYSLGPVALGISTYIPLSEEAMNLFRRFLKVFELSYRRYLDIEKAEAQAREAQIETALEKVRSRSLAMHKTDELREVVTVVFMKLKELGVGLNVTGAIIGIFTEGSRDIEHWLASPDFSLSENYKVPYFDHPINKDIWESKEKGEEVFFKTYSFEEKNSFQKSLWNYTDYKYMPDEVKNWVLATENYMLLTAFQKNSAIILYSFNTILPSDKEVEIVKRFSKVFEQSYIRFLDLQKAEKQALRAEQDLIEIKTARKKAEDALTELRSTQTQLIQAEKMASLGELTAGIAHEIQNPLNFVNNFSEVNQEMVDEATEEINKGNIEEVKNILSDIKNNSEKINHHGKRADAIVKGMLQHSRKSEGKKEPTDINALCDEYLRLSYHGLRAKDKSFNADFKTDFDETIGKINIAPQDIGRVLLNLINNAFYAVNEKFAVQSSSLTANYKPLVSVQTKKINAKVEIKVSDTGNGIPQNIIDKIFQPFFTTKPTGQGTGLGLSLSYDIVKAHSGEIKVETKEGEGTTFIIRLSTNQFL